MWYTSIRCSIVCNRTDISDSTRMVFFLRFRRLGIADAFKSLLVQYDGITAAGCLTYALQMLQYYRVRERMFSRMTIDEIKKLIAKDETRTLELKKTTGELHRGMETACAFLNSEG